MVNAAKFLFNTDFDSREARAEVGGPRYSETELAAARHLAYGQGMAEGRAQAEADTERLVAEALATLAARVGEVRAAQAHALEAFADDAVKLATTIGRKLASTLMEAQPLAEIEALVSDCLARLTDEPRVVVRVNESVLDSLRERIDALAQRSGFTGMIVLLGDAAITETDCRVEWADGGAERDIARLSQEIEATIERLVRARAASAFSKSGAACADAVDPHP